MYLNKVIKYRYKHFKLTCSCTVHSGKLLLKFSYRFEAASYYFGVTDASQVW